MTGALSLLVPWALLALFLYRSLRSRIFLLGIPFLIVMDSSVYFDGMRVFHVPGRLSGTYVLLLLWLFFVWLVATDKMGLSGRSRPQAPVLHDSSLRARFLPEESALIVLVVLALGHAAGSFAQTGDLQDALGRSLPMLTMVVGYFLIRDIVARASTAEVTSFLATLIGANAVATVLFIVHQGLHISVYPAAEYFTTFFAGQEITRTFTFAPRFGLVFLTIAFVVSRRRWTVGWGVVLLITLVGVWVTYTRSLLLVTGVSVALSILLTEVKHPSARRLTRRLLLSVGLTLTVLFSLFLLLPAESRYFEQRLADLTGGKAASDASYIYREVRFRQTVEMVNKDGRLTLGEGFPTAREDPLAPRVALWGADMAWLLVVFYVGMAGLLAIALLFVGFGLRTAVTFRRTSGEGEFLALTYLVAIVASLLTTGISRSFMEPAVLPMALWLFAFVGAEAIRRPPEVAESAAVEAAA